MKKENATLLDLGEKRKGVRCIHTCDRCNAEGENNDAERPPAGWVALEVSLSGSFEASDMGRKVTCVAKAFARTWCGACWQRAEAPP